MSENPYFSKDYIEHLRSVHFTLMAISILLTFLAFSPDPSQYKEAKDQLIDIQRVDRAEVENIVYREYEKSLKSWNNSDSVTLLATDATLMNVPALNKSFSISFKPLRHGFVRFMPDFVGFDPPDAPDFPKDPHSFSSLVEFRTFWDALYTHNALRLPASPPLTVFTQQKAKQQVVVPFDDKAGVKEVPAAFSKGEPADTSLEFVIAPCNPAVKDALAGRHAECHYMYLAGWAAGKLWFAIPIEEQRYTAFDLQKPFLDGNPGWVGGKFESSFALLDQLSTNIQDLRLETLRKVLENEQSRKADSFEVVGIKFPSETTRWAGFVVLCGIFLYLLLLLHSRPLGLGQRSSGEEVAWVGIFESLGARALVFTSIVPLPAFAFGAVAFAKATSRVGTWRVIGLSFASIVILAFSILTWLSLERFRNTLRTSRCAVQESPKT
jgi:hypothetical protein